MEWKCTQCGRCCKKWNMSIDLEDVKNMQKCGHDTDKFLNFRNGRMILKHKNSQCVFLSKNNICDIHIKNGYEFKPKVCRKFPFDENNVNRLVCGHVTKVKSKEKIPLMQKDMIFRYKNKIIPFETLLYAINNIEPSDYVNSWYSILKSMEKCRKNIISTGSIDNCQNTKKITKLRKIQMKMLLAGYSRLFFPELCLILSRKFTVPLKFETEKMKLKYKDVDKVQIDNKEKEKFFILLKKGHGIIHKQYYPEHLLFSLFFLDDFSKQIAYENKKEKADVIDMLNAFSILNSGVQFA